MSLSLPSESITLVRCLTSHEDSMMENQHGGMLISNEKAIYMHQTSRDKNLLGQNIERNREYDGGGETTIKWWNNCAMQTIY